MNTSSKLRLALALASFTAVMLLSCGDVLADSPWGGGHSGHSFAGRTSWGGGYHGGGFSNSWGGGYRSGGFSGSWGGGYRGGGFSDHGWRGNSYRPSYSSYGWGWREPYRRTYVSPSYYYPRPYHNSGVTIIIVP